MLGRSIKHIGDIRSKLFNFAFKLQIMSAIIIKVDKKSSKLISDLANQLSANVIDMKTQQYEDYSYR
jgi:hypothetical protein